MVFDGQQERAERILVVDDDPSLVMVIEATLAGEGFHVSSAGSGNEALHLARETRPDLVLLDVMMPKLDGLEVCRRLRADRNTRYVCIILLTAKASSEDKVMGLRAGADDYLTKPFDPAELVERVRATLRRSREMRDLNPLTSLPGNDQICVQLRSRLSRPQPTSLLHIDIDHFKAFNDYYGFLRGDRAICLLARSIEDTLIEEGCEDSFVGHIGGDDFAVITDPHQAETLAKQIIQCWTDRVGTLYEPMDLDRGYIEASNRHREQKRYGLLTLSIGIASNAFRSITSEIQMVDVATEMKRVAKRGTDSSWAADRRQQDRRAGDAELPPDKETLLIVDDDPDLRAMIRIALEDAFHIVEATNGVEAYLMATTKRPKFVLLDYRMPELDGPYAAELIREDVPDAVIIAVSGEIDAKPDWADSFLMKDQGLGASSLREKILGLKKA